MKKIAFYATALLSMLLIHLAAAQPTVITDISFGGSRAGVIAVNSVTNMVYAAQEDVPTIAVINGMTNTVVTTIPTAGFHAGIDVNSSTNRVYVSQQFTGSVRIIDGATNTVIADLPVPGAPIGDVTINPATGKLYVIRPNASDVAVFDAANNFLYAIPVPATPGSITVNSTLNRIYVASGINSGVVTVIDGASDAVITSVPHGSTGSSRIAVNSVTHRVYVTNATGNVAIIDGTTNSVLPPIPGTGFVGVAVNPSTNRIYVGDFSNDTVAIFDGATNAAVTTVAVGDQPHDIAIIPNTNRIYVSNDGGHSVSVIEDLPNVVTVAIDIKPSSNPNSINPNSNGVIPVAILTISSFDATTVDPLSAKFGPTGAAESHGKGHIQDADGDGDMDMVLHFKTQQTGIQCGETSASLIGKTVGGQDITGTDAIQTVGCTAKAVAEAEIGLPDGFALFQNYPNPFNPETEIRFQLSEASPVVVKIFTLSGEEIRTLANAAFERGNHRLRWDGKDKRGNAVASGMYLYQLRASNFSQVRKMSLLR